MKSAELLRKLKRVAKAHGVELEIKPAKGSHQKIRLGDKATILPIHNNLPIHNKELKTGLLRGILKDLGVAEEEL